MPSIRYYYAMLRVTPAMMPRGAKARALLMMPSAHHRLPQRPIIDIYAMPSAPCHGHF